MTNPAPDPRDRARPETDRIEALLETQLRRVRRRFLVHGLGWMVAAATLLVLVYFSLDRGLELPGLVRVVVTLVVGGFLAMGVRRRLIYPMRRAFGRSDVAIAIEQRFPELHSKLISAHQLGRSLRDTPQTLRDQSQAMIAKVVDGAAADVARLPVGRILTPRRTVRVWAFAGALLLTLSFGIAGQFDSFGIFLRRAFGADVEYPRRTHLVVELQDDNPEYRVAHQPGRSTVTMAGGGDLTVLVRADGVIPREVYLIVAGARGLPPEIGMTRRPGPDGRFRYTFKRVRGEFEFHASGGDDDRGDRSVMVRTIEPPLVGNIAATLTYPAYTGRATETRSGGAIEALIGTEVRLQVTATGPVLTAELQFLENGGSLSLEPTTINDDSGTGQQFAGTFTIARSDRYEIRLVSPDGLGNPRPGDYPVVALEDHEPVGRLLLPDGEDVHVALPTGFIPVRLLALDDFGLRTVYAEVQSETAGDPARVDLFEAAVAVGPEVGPDGTRPAPVRETVLDELLPLATLVAPAIGDTVSIRIHLTDNREPEPLVSELSRRQIHIVDAVDLTRRIAVRFRRIREDVDTALSRQIDRAAELAATLEDLPDPTRGRVTELVALEVGQNQILMAVRRVHGELMKAYDLHLFNGLEGPSRHADAARNLYLDVARSDETDEPRLPAFHRRIAEEQRAGRIGPMEKVLDPILDLTLLGDRIATDWAAQAALTAERAGITASREDLRERLTELGRLQTQIIGGLEQLRARLVEWNDFQDLIQQARALRDAQRDVENRTRGLRKDD